MVPERDDDDDDDGGRVFMTAGEVPGEFSMPPSFSLAASRCPRE